MFNAIYNNYSRVTCSIYLFISQSCSNEVTRQVTIYSLTSVFFVAIFRYTLLGFFEDMAVIKKQSLVKVNLELGEIENRLQILHSSGTGRQRNPDFKQTRS